MIPYGRKPRQHSSPESAAEIEAAEPLIKTRADSRDQKCQKAKLELS